MREMAEERKENARNFIESYIYSGQGVPRVETVREAVGGSPRVLTAIIGEYIDHSSHMPTPKMLRILMEASATETAQEAAEGLGTEIILSEIERRTLESDDRARELARQLNRLRREGRIGRQAQ